MDTFLNKSAVHAAAIRPIAAALSVAVADFALDRRRHNGDCVGVAVVVLHDDAVVGRRSGAASLVRTICLIPGRARR